MELKSQSSMCVAEEEEQKELTISHIFNEPSLGKRKNTSASGEDTRYCSIDSRSTYVSIIEGRARDVTVFMSPPRTSFSSVIIVVVAVVVALHHIAILMMR